MQLGGLNPVELLFGFAYQGTLEGIDCIIALTFCLRHEYINDKHCMLRNGSWTMSINIYRGLMFNCICIFVFEVNQPKCQFFANENQFYSLRPRECES